MNKTGEKIVKLTRFVITLVSLLVLLSAASPAEQNTSSGQDSSDVQTLATIEPHADFLTLSSDQTLLCATYSKKKGYDSLNEGWLKVWRLNSAPPMLAWEWKLSGYRINQMAVSPDGRTLAAVCSDAKIRLWDAQTSKFRRAIKAPAEEVRSRNAPALAATYSAVAYALDGQTLAIAGGTYRHANHDPQDPNVQSMIQLLDAHTLTLRHSFFILGIPATMRFAPDNKHIAIWCSTANENQVFGHRA